MNPNVAPAPREIVFLAEQFLEAINGVAVPDEEFSPEPGVRILARALWWPCVSGTPSLYIPEEDRAARTREVLRRGYTDPEAALAVMPGDYLGRSARPTRSKPKGGARGETGVNLRPQIQISGRISSPDPPVIPRPDDRAARLAGRSQQCPPRP